MKKNIVWLASYPKSGNTWFRIFLSNLRSEKAAPIDINEIQTNGISSSKEIFEKATGVNASYLTTTEIDSLRPDIFRYYSNRMDDLFFIKAHDAYTYLPNQEPLFPTDASYGVIYFVRNPLDVAVSYAFHNGTLMEEAHSILSKNITLAKPKRYQHQLHQQVLTWSTNVESWLNQKDIPILLLRYEDMKVKPLETFRKAIQFLNWGYSDEAIKEALDKSSFKSLKKQEKEKGFRERLKEQKQFFRSGKVGDWALHLSSEQIVDIKEKHASVIKKLSYDTYI
jgi:hypothetical protein